MQVKIALAALLPTLVLGSPRLRENQPNEAIRVRDPFQPRDLFARDAAPVLKCAAPSPSLPNPDPKDCQAIATQAAGLSFKTCTTGVILTYGTCTIQVVNPGVVTAGSTLKTASDAISQCATNAGVYPIPVSGSGTQTAGAITIGYSDQAAASTKGLTIGSICGSGGVGA